MCAGATLTLKLKTDTFDLRTRDSSTGRLVGSAAGLLARALPALEKELRLERGVKLRLLGVRLSRLQREGEQSAGGTRRLDVLWRGGGGGGGGGGGIGSSGGGSNSGMPMRQCLDSPFWVALWGPPRLLPFTQNSSDFLQ